MTTPLNEDDFKLIVRSVECPPYSFGIGTDPAPEGTIRRCWLQVSAMLPDNTKAGANAAIQKGRKWFLSNYMTKSEVVQTMLKAVLTFEEHEIRERFKYRGVPIFDPHYDVDKLLVLRNYPEALSEREPMPGKTDRAGAEARRTDWAKVDATSEAEILRQMAVDGEVPDCGHGWVIPRADGRITYCGGPNRCEKCAADAKALALYTSRLNEAQAPAPLMGALVGDLLIGAGQAKPAPAWGHP